MKKIILVISLMMLTSLMNFSYSQALNIGLKTEKDCNTDVFYITIQLYLDTTATVQIGNSSILFSFNSDAIVYKNYQALHFNGSDSCAGAGTTSWDVHRVDEVSFTDQFHLLLSLVDTNYSCPAISNLDTINLGVVSFDILQQGSNPFIYIDTSMTWFNSDIPNSGAGMLTLGNIASIDSSGVLLCDCPGEGQTCDDNNVLTVNDVYNIYCNCEGEYLDSDQDGILDGIDPCSDIVYEAEDAELGDVAVGNTYYQHTGTGYVNFLHSTGDSIEFTISPQDTGTYYMYFKYSLSYGNRPLEFSIDGNIINSSLDFPSTGDWNDWDTISFANYFTPGNHSVLFVTVGSEGPMFDHLRLSICTGCVNAGNVCDDGDTCTVSDVFDADCNCNGIYLDSDNDGVCNTFDICDGGIDSLDIDFDGIPDYCDDCNDLLVGTACDDGNPCTVDDSLNASCFCEGVWLFADSDGDGVCDSLDICIGGDDNIDEDNDSIPDFCDPCNGLLQGIPCNDGDTCTVLDAFDVDCNCVGVYLDSDGDGICNTLDQCEGSSDSLDYDFDGIPDDCDDCDNLTTGTPCDDENICTVNDSIDINCECVGEYLDSDYDGICDSLDLCPGYPDDFDNDGDAIPNDCDNCYDLVYQAEDMYFSSSAIYGVGGNASGSGYVRFTNNIDTVIFIVMPGDTGMTTVTIRYSQDEEGKTGLIKLDGQVLFEDFEYPKVNDDWQIWDTVQFDVYLSPGFHSIELINNDQDPYGPRIDYLSLCTPGYIPSPRIARGNDQFEEGFNNWIRLLNWGALPSNISIDSLNAFCGFNDAYFGYASGYQQIFTTLDNLLIGDTMCLHFYVASGMANAWVSPLSSSVFDGTYHFVNANLAGGDYMHDSIEFIVTEPTMLIWFDVFPNSELYLDNFSFDGYACEPDPELDINGISCYGETDASISVDCSGGAYPIDYLWNTGDTIQTISNLTAGWYSVTAVDKNGTENSVSYEVIEPVELSIISSVGNETDTSTYDGEISITTFGGTEPYEFEWSTGSFSEDIYNLSQGLYLLSISDFNDCSIDTVFEVYTISQLPKPNWSYQITSTSHVVLIQPSAQIDFDGGPLEVGDFIGAFYDSLGEYACAGYVMWMNSTSAVTIFGDDQYSPEPDGFTAGDPIDWKVWRYADSSLVNAYTTYIPSFPDSGYFNPNGLSGIANMYCECYFNTQMITLHQGWDIYSTFLNLIDSDISVVFDSIINNVNIIKDSDGNVFWPLFNYNAIVDMNIGEAYYVNMSQTDDLYLTGYIADPSLTPISLPFGWSLIGYVRTSPASVITMFSPIVNDILIVKNGDGQIYWPAFSVNSIGNMIPGSGYIINMINPQTFNYPPNTVQSTKSVTENCQQVYYKKVKNGNSNMTLGIPKNAWLDRPDIGDEIGVFSESGTLVGTGVYNGRNMAITVWGDDTYSDRKDGLIKNELFSIRIWKHSTNIEKELQFSYTNGDDATYAENKILIVKDAFGLVSIDNNIILWQNIPNPFSAETVFKIYLPESSNVRLSIYSLLGEEVDIIFSGEKAKGNHSISYKNENLATGSYYYQISAKNFSETKKMMILKD